MAISRATEDEHRPETCREAPSAYTNPTPHPTPHPTSLQSLPAACAVVTARPRRARRVGVDGLSDKRTALKIEPIRRGGGVRGVGGGRGGHRIGVLGGRGGFIIRPGEKGVEESGLGLGLGV